ncbi:hypothetical protein KAW18_13445 [candidate division WOR-3 bacterium]|nr:hypothetical protein [candidate division WOR-3 bacterium]
MDRIQRASPILFTPSNNYPLNVEEIYIYLTMSTHYVIPYYEVTLLVMIYILYHIFNNDNYNYDDDTDLDCFRNLTP